METTLLLNTSMLLTLTIILMPILLSLLLTPHSTAFLTSLVPMTIFMYSGSESIISHSESKFITNFKIPFSLKIDQYSMMFFPIALFVTSSILQFALSYMASEPHITKFFFFLLMFLIAMLTLTIANNMFLLFIGSEGVGIMSFLLIGDDKAEQKPTQPHSKPSSTTELGMSASSKHSMPSLNNKHLTNPTSTLPQPNSNPPPSTIYPSSHTKICPIWPPSMTTRRHTTPNPSLCPTPLQHHSSCWNLPTHPHPPLLSTNQTALTLCLCLGALSTLFAATCALTQNDIKKIIAFSTSSQLGLMMVTIGLNLPQLAFFHISTHAFFKAMLFLCSGSIIHALNGEQDIRKMGSLQKVLPTTTTCLTIGNLALMGTPFLAGFYSKDLIIESLNTSYLNASALLLTLLATSFTATYSLRMTLLVQTSFPRMPTITPMNENTPTLINPITRLALGSIVAGLLITSYIPPTKTPPMTMPTLTKTTAIIITTLGIILALELSNLTHTLTQPKQTLSLNFSSMLGYYNSLTHRLTSLTLLHSGQKIASHLIDLSSYKKMGPEGIADLQLTATKTSTPLHTGLIKAYLGTFALSTFIILLSAH
uniref:NADH-ubiquinone oxidoreductase chain 5 n=1 Tax=Aquila audax TaxID=8961 RepID=A0A3G5FPY5_AQUAU